MKILLLSPQPFFQERGTCIAIDLLLSSLSERGDEVDVLTYHLGEDRDYSGGTITRIKPPFAPTAIKHGFSLRKVYCDLFLLCGAFRMVRKKRYELIHAVEESSFIAMILNRFFHIPYVVDMDSSLSDQILLNFAWTRPVGRILRWIETLPLRRAVAVVPMCEELAIFARQHTFGFVYILKDVSLVAVSEGVPEDLRHYLGIKGPILMYVGNMAPYQGIDLLFEAFAELRRSHPQVELVLIGGTESHIRKYQIKARSLGIHGQTHLLGPRPMAALGGYLRQAALLISPRISGTNTPMKLYSYLDTGIAVVATALPTHTQVVSGDEAELVPPEPSAMATAIADLLNDVTKCRTLARNAQGLVRREHSLATFRKNVERIFGELENRLDVID